MYHVVWDRRQIEEHCGKSGKPRLQNVNACQLAKQSLDRWPRQRDQAEPELEQAQVWHEPESQT